MKINRLQAPKKQTQTNPISNPVKIFLNLPEILNQIEKITSQLAKPTAFYLGKLQDGLALDAPTGYSRAFLCASQDRRSYRHSIDQCLQYDGVYKHNRISKLWSAQSLSAAVIHSRKAQLRN